MSESGFGPGDIVRLRSGGPAMTVARLDGARGDVKACCIWFEARGRPHFYYLELCTIEPAAADAEPDPKGR
ncbi:MAG TPA: DUF2158 domain-containing protein [Caulobacteraceae bacterium]|nr:DUF2158 domain-containing protein [Caulobacteraceae bacterium]